MRLLRTFAFITAILLAPSLARAHQENSNFPGEPDASIKFAVDSSNQFNPDYELIWEALTPLYKGTNRDKNNKDAINPIIGNAQIDLNGDKIPEIIAYHVESEQEKGVFCNKNGLCPYYIFDTSGKKIRIVGIIYANAINRGDSIKNRYWTLKAYKNLPDWDRYELYTFNPSHKKYEPEAKEKTE